LFSDGIQMDSDSNSIVHYPNVQRIFVEKVISTFIISYSEQLFDNY